MPTKSQAQHSFMEAAAHNPAFAKKAGITPSVANEFVLADVGRKLGGLPQHVKKSKPKGKRR